MSRELLDLSEEAVLVTTSGLRVERVFKQELIEREDQIMVCIVDAENSRLVNMNNCGTIYALKGYILKGFKVINPKKKLWVNIYRNKLQGTFTSFVHTTKKEAEEAEESVECAYKTIVLAKEIDHDV